MKRPALLLAATAMLAACGPDGPPDTPLYSIDQTRPAAAPDPALQGCWTGVLETTVEPRRLIFQVSLNPQSVRMISPDQGGAAVRFEQVRLDGPRLAAATPLGAFRFDGALDGPDRLSGEVVQGGLSDTLLLERAPESEQLC